MRRNNTVYLLAVMSLMIAIMILFGFTPIGTIATPAFTITLMGIPVAVIACVFGPIMGLVAGSVWGIISIIQAFSGMDATGVLLLSAPDIPAANKYIGLIFMCLIARMLTGFLAGFFFDLVKRFDKRGFFASFAGSLSTAFFNTLFFMSFFVIFFFNTEAVQNTYVNAFIEAGWAAQNPFIFVIAVIGFNFVVELLVNAIVGSFVSFGITQGARKIGLSNPLPRFFAKKEQSA